jgi:hypothetical protein
VSQWYSPCKIFERLWITSANDRFWNIMATYLNALRYPLNVQVNICQSDKNQTNLVASFSRKFHKLNGMMPT